jgi:hypothetical protein
MECFKVFSSLYTSANEDKSTVSIDFDITNKF